MKLPATRLFLQQLAQVNITATSKLRITGQLWGESRGDRWKGQNHVQNCKAFPCHYVTCWVIQVPDVVTYNYDDVIKWQHFCVTSLLCREFAGDRWIPLTKASDAKLWCFLWSAPSINGWVNKRDTNDLRSHRVHYDVIIMCVWKWVIIDCYLLSQNQNVVINAKTPTEPHKTIIKRKRTNIYNMRYIF